MACPVPVHQDPDLLGAGREVPDERLHLPIPVRLRRRDDADARGEAIEDAAEVVGISRSTAYEHWSYARVRLKTLLDGE